MIRSRPFGALFAGLFLLHLVVVGSGDAMGIPEGGAMQGMQMAASSMPGLAGADAHYAPASESDEVPCPGMPCEATGMPSSCPSTLLCFSGTSLPAPYERLLAGFTSDLRPLPVAARAAHARVPPPELPPPRA
jgi:hypothetical protein